MLLHDLEVRKYRMLRYGDQQGKIHQITTKLIPRSEESNSCEFPLLGVGGLVVVGGDVVGGLGTAFLGLILQLPTV